MDLQNVLAWLSGADSGAFVVISVAVSVLLEDTKWWNGLKSKFKYLIILAFAILLGIGSAILASYPVAVAAIDPYFKPFMYAVLAWLATQGIHSAGNVAKFFNEDNNKLPPI